MRDPAAGEGREIDIVLVEMGARVRAGFQLHQPAAFTDASLERIEHLSLCRIFGPDEGVGDRRQAEVADHPGKGAAAGHALCNAHWRYSSIWSSIRLAAAAGSCSTARYHSAVFCTASLNDHLDRQRNACRARLESR